jgi:hypothetical protein
MISSSILAFALLVVLSVPAAHTQDSSAVLARAKANLSGMLAEDMYEMVRIKLANSGLPPSDVDRAAQIWTDGVASCAVDALASDADPKAAQLLIALSRSETEAELNEQLPETDPKGDTVFFESLKPKLEECFHIVVQEAGIVR